MASSRPVSSAVVLLSAGLDSTYNLLRAMQEYTVKMVLTFDYGQRAARKEVERATQLARHFKLQHEVIPLPWFRQFTKTALLGGMDLPQGEDVQIDNLTRSLETAKSVWVPNRNGIFLNIAAGFAEGLGANFVIPGFNYEEAQTFPDNSMAFLKALNSCWVFSTESKVQAKCFSGELSKTEIIMQAIPLKLPFSMLWPCYLEQEEWCGECESCLRFKRALTDNGLSFDQLKRAST